MYFELTDETEKSSEAPNKEDIEDDLTKFIIDTVKWKGEVDDEYFNRFWRIDSDELSEAVEDLKDEELPIEISTPGSEVEPDDTEQTRVWEYDDEREGVGTREYSLRTTSPQSETYFDIFTPRRETRHGNLDIPILVLPSTEYLSEEAIELIYQQYGIHRERR